MVLFNVSIQYVMEHRVKNKQLLNMSTHFY